MATTTGTLQGRALNRLEALRSPACEKALQEVRAAEDPEVVIAELDPAPVEYVELALLTTMTTSICAARKMGDSAEAIEARANTLPEPLRERLQEMVREQWGRWRR